MSSKNVGWRDAAVRWFVGLVLLVTSAALQARPLISLGVGFMALIFIGTGLFRTCPLYTLLHLNTCRRPRPV